MKAKENIARAAATEWCRCWKCDGVVRHSGSKCDKAKLLTCHKWYHSYRAALLTIEEYEQQMMKDAIDGEVLKNYDGKVLEYDDSILDEKLSNCNVFDKVKIIVIK